MPTVFVAGSMNIKKLDNKFIERLEKIAASNLDVVVGDADGADTSIQIFLKNSGATAVTVYCSGAQPRNNVGSWPIHNVRTNAEPGTRAFFTAKDVEMAQIADFGLMIWDTKSTGTLSNVIELIKRGKKCVVFVNKEKDFITVSNAHGLRGLISTMSDGAKIKAEDKLKLSSLLATLTNEQFALQV